MNDRELLELAAKAVGIEPASYMGRDVGWYVPGRGVGSWNPLTDDGDALRLAVQLRIDVVFSNEIHPMHAHHQVTAWYGDNADRVDEFMRDPMAATRRAIVRAAAEIGKAMQ